MEGNYNGRKKQMPTLVLKSNFGMPPVCFGGIFQRQSVEK